MSFRNDDDFDKESYVSVNMRLLEFWKDHPKGRIETGYQLQDGVLVMVAKLYRQGEDKPASSGHAFLERLDGDKVGEYTETVAVGRALALMGYKVEKSIASADEMKRFNDRKDSKTEAKTSPARIPGSMKKESAPSSVPATGQAQTPNVGQAMGGTYHAAASLPQGVQNAQVVEVAKPQAEQEPASVPNVPRTLKTTRIFKPLQKNA